MKTAEMFSVGKERGGKSYFMDLICTGCISMKKHWTYIKFNCAFTMAQCVSFPSFLDYSFVQHDCQFSINSTPVELLGFINLST